ncbi:MAG: alpha/beta fold hydrolase [Anaerolineae bacterium]
MAGRVVRRRLRGEVERNYDPIALERQTAAILTVGDRRERLRQLRLPTVVVHGDADPLVPVENGRELAASIPDADLIVVPGMGHDAPLQLVPIFADAITAAARRAGPP